MSAVVVPLYCVICYIYIPGTLGHCFHYYYYSLWCVQMIWPFMAAGRLFVCFHITLHLYHHYADLPGHWTSDIFVRYMLSNVYLIMIVERRTLSYHHHQMPAWSNIHAPVNHLPSQLWHGRCKIFISLFFERRYFLNQISVELLM